MLAAAHAAMSEADLARFEWQAAGAAFAALGAHGMASRVQALIDGPEIVPPEHSQMAALRRDGDRWHLVHGGRSVTVPDLKGVRLLARLLAEPGREFPALDLAGAGVVEPGLPVLDDEAKASYRRRLAEAEEDLAEAERNNDEARRALAERDRGYLLAEPSGAFGLTGRVRATGGTVERARTSVTHSLRYALARITAGHPELGGHLGSAVRTGAYCSYSPDPVVPLTWEITL